MQNNVEVKNLEKRLSQIRTALLSSHPFFGTVVANFEFTITKNIPSIAATDCYKTIYFHPICEKMPNDELLFVALHEVLHAVLLHSQRRAKRNPDLWFTACDYAVNSILIDEMHKKMPETFPGLYDKRFSGKTAEEIYRMLEEEVMCSPSFTIRLSGNLAGNNEQCSESSASGQGEQDIQITLTQDEYGNTKIKVNGITSDLIEPKNQTEAKEAEEKMRSVIIQAHLLAQKFERSRGNIPSSVREFIKEIIEPKVPFERLLARFTSQIISGKSEYTFNPINKKYALYYDVALPTVRGEEAPKVVLAIDTSGSIKSEELKIFAGAIKKLSTITSELTVITCDCSIKQVIKTSDIENFLKNIEFSGRGGTSHIPVFNWIEKEFVKKEGYPDVTICLTDGYSEYPAKKPKYPVIWCLTPNHKEPPWGQKLIIN